jgi:sec-independent protein translocase protein TatA
MGFSIPSIILILVIVILLFGTSKLKNMGSDLGSALKGFKKAVTEDEDEKQRDNKDADFAPLDKPDGQTNDAQSVKSGDNVTSDHNQKQK